MQRARRRRQPAGSDRLRRAAGRAAAWLVAGLLLHSFAGSPLLRRAAADGGKDPSMVHLRRGGELYQAGQYDQATVELRAAYELTPLPRILCNLAQAYRKGGHPTEALENYQLCLRLDPNLTATERADFKGYVEQLRAEQARRSPPPPVATGATGDASTVAAPPPPVPLYKRAWFWGIIGGAVAVTAIAVGVGVGVSQKSAPSPPDGVPVLVF